MKIRHVALAGAVLLAIACSTSGAASLREPSDPVVSDQETQEGGEQPSTDAQGTASPAGEDHEAGNASTPADSDANAAAEGNTSEQEGQRSDASSRPSAHAGDKVLTGKVSRISSDAITIETSGGESRTLTIVDETLFQVNGRNARRSDIRQGADVRARYSEQDGEDVAVKVNARRSGAGKRRAHPR